jgi:hypothetical protein
LSVWGGAGNRRINAILQTAAAGIQVLVRLTYNKTGYTIIVPDPGKGVCADPVNGGAILGKGGPDPQGGNKEHQLSPDKGRDKT